MDKTHIDHLYDYIEIDDETLKLLQKESLAQEINRVKEISHLGIIHQLYPLSKHSKFEHALGVYYLSRLAEKNLESQIKKVNIESKFLKIASILHGIGHLPFTYATEKAICLLYYMNTDIKKEVNDIIENVCVSLGFSSSEKTKSLKLLKSGYYGDLHRWFEAYKIIKNNDLSEHSKKTIARYIIDKESHGFKLLYFLDQLDYVMRDAYYINLFTLKINLIPFFKGIKISRDGEIHPPADINVIEPYYNLLREKVYRSPGVIILEDIFSRMIVEIFQREDKIGNLEFLLSKTDNDLINHLQEIKYRFGKNELTFEEISREVKNQNIRRVYSSEISTSIENLIKLERKIVHKNMDHIIDYPKRTGYLVHVEKNPIEEDIITFDDRNIFDVQIFWHKENKDPKIILNAISEIEKINVNYFQKSKEKVASFILGHKVKPRYQKLKEKVQRDILRFLKTKNFNSDDAFRLISKRLGELDFIEDFAPILKLGEREIEKHKLDLLIESLIESPEIFSKDFLRDFNVYLKDAHVRARREHKQILNEYETYIYRVYKGLSSGSNQWILPCMEIIDEETKEQLKEIDVFSVQFTKGHKPVIFMEEVSETESETKLTKTREKFGFVRKMISSRFPRRFYYKFFYNNSEIKIN